MSTPVSEAASDPARLTLCAAAAAIRNGTLTAEALARAYALRIDEQESIVRAWAWFDKDRMLTRARRADEELQAGRMRGPLHGIPVAVKDIIDTEGVPTRMGSPIFERYVPEASAECILRLERAGAYVQGKTVTTEFATREPGPTGNPWNAACTPGGSSSGSAAAVAAGFTAGALGSQTRGSIIRPAAYCGVVGFKPSLGLLSRTGVLRLSDVLDHVGVFTRNVDDATLLCTVLAGEDPLDPATRLPAFAPLQQVIEQAPRLAVVHTSAWNQADQSQRALFEANCRRLTLAGAQLIELQLPEGFDAADAAISTLQLHDIAHGFQTLARDAEDRMSPSFRAFCRQGAEISREQYDAAMAKRRQLQEAFERLIVGFDAVLTPPATGEAPATLKTTGDPVFCILWTLLGVPSVAIPTGRGERSLPMGLQIVGPYLQDGRTLAVAKWCSDHLPFDPPLPF